MAESPKDGSPRSSSLMDDLLGLLRIRVKRGINLAVRDVRSSDPYVVVKMGKQKLKTRVIKKDVNPEWNEDLTLSVMDPSVPIRMTVAIPFLLPSRHVSLKAPELPVPDAFSVPCRDVFGGHEYGAATDHKEVRLAVSPGKVEGHRENQEEFMERDDFSFGNRREMNNVQEGPAVMAAASIAVGLRGVLLHVAIVQAALPQGIVPFVFAKEYNVHPDILSTAVIFGMLIALPITLVYYILLGI
ncbi:hypothetical protein V6N12_043206 [Hibiscus sabdariffa]|uniref:C2 domain-containing protein n=1 Tax=Hibiscus sabdariffa TaxID=183260 RepID=A0ABR2DDN5_9ROSI